MLKRIGLPVVLLAGLLAFAAPRHANAETHFGIYIGPSAPVYSYPAYPYSDYYYNPAPVYTYPAPYYAAPYSYGNYGRGWRDHDRHEWREHERHEFRERGEHGGWRR